MVESAIHAHKTLDQMKQEKILAPWEKWSRDFIHTDAWIETLYNSLTGSQGKFIKTQLTDHLDLSGNCRVPKTDEILQGDVVQIDLHPI